MQFSRKALVTLEYDKIIEMLSSLASTEGAAVRARSLLPTDDYEAVIQRQARTNDAKRLVNSKGYPSFSASETVPGSAERAYKGAVLSASELLNIASLLTSTRLLVDYIRSDKLFDTSLDELFERLLPCNTLENKIKKTIISEDRIADEASPELADIRRKIKITNNRIKDTLQSYISGNKLKYLQENIVTMRNGRYVVPVKAEYRNEFKGLVHDTSSSGATLFIEPMAVVDANNELKGLFAKEKFEIEKILTSLSAEVGEQSSLITLNYHNITEIAFIFACASLAISMNAEQPIMVNKRIVNLKKARHPLLDKKSVVPIDISIGEECDTLVITGPNTGGKTVSLKTVGLLTLMAQSGLQIPAYERSQLGVFEGILVDIGDEQSIEASLSTFSSHMVNVIDILSKLNPKTMVLYDELGSGTDPIEGAALAIAILEKSQKLGALTLATTHYAELKAYALDTKSVQNASCEFNIETLKPTYKLVIGTPGRSNAFAISEKLGMPDDVVSRAGELITRENKRFEDVIERLDTDRMKMEAELEKAEKLRVEYENFKQTSETELKKKISKIEDETQKTLLKARQILDSARATSDFIFKRLEEVKRQEDKTLRDKMMSEAREEIMHRMRESENSFDSISVESLLADDYTLPRPLKIGDRVYVISVGAEGVITAIADKKGLYSVTSGILKTKVTEDKLRLLDGNVKYKQPRAPEPISEGKIKKSIVSGFKLEIDVRGMIGDDAWFAVDKHIDDAILASVPSVRIIHGKGTGALRAALWKNFRVDRRIKSFKHAEYGDGDAGVTIVELKQ